MAEQPPAGFAKPTFIWHDPAAQLAPPPWALRVTTAAEARARMAAGVPPLVVIAGEGDPEGAAALALKHENCTLVLDEIDRASMGTKRWTAPSVGRIVHEGRPRGVNLWGTCRRTANVPEDLLSQLDCALVFRHSDFGAYDIEALRRRMGDARADAAVTLEPLHFVAWADGLD